MDLRLSYNFRWTSETYVDNLLITLRDRGGFGKVAFWLFENNMLQSISRKTFLSWRELKQTLSLLELQEKSKDIPVMAGTETDR